jgi:hypothetical protein
LLTPSRLRRKVRAFVENPRGFSSIIGAIFAVIIIIFVATSVFMWTLSQNTVYNDATRQTNQMEADRLNENVIAASTNITFSTNAVNVTAELTNLGSTTASVVNLWVTDATIGLYNYTSTRINVVLSPGNKTLVSRIVYIQGVSSSDTVGGYFVTARGNSVHFQGFYDVMQSLISQGVGSLIFNFYQFRYYNYSTSVKLYDYYPNYNQGGNKNYTIPASTNLAFGAVITNLDPRGRTFNFTSASQLWCPLVNTQGSPHPKTGLWVVKAAIDGTLSAYSDSNPSYSVSYGQTALIVFASNDGPGQFSGGSGLDAATSANTIPVFLELHGYFYPPGQTTKTYYGQCIPFVSLYCP